MFKFLHTADIHLDSPLHRLDEYEGVPAGEVRGATRRAFRKLVDRAVQEAVDFVLICGDLFDGDWRDYNTGLFFVSEMNRLKVEKIPVFLISGNHDAASRVTKSLRWPENVVVFPVHKPDTRILDSVGAAIHGQGFPTPVLKRNLVPAYPDPVPGVFNIGLLHTAVTGREGHEPYAPCRLDDLREKGYDYWALGHVHRHETVLEDPPAVFSGCIQGRHIREAGPKGCVLVHVEAGRKCRWEFIPLDVVRWVPVEVPVPGARDLPDCVAAAREAMARALEKHAPAPLVIRIRFTGPTPATDALHAHPEELLYELRSAALDVGGGNLWMEKVQNHTHPADDARASDSLLGPLAEISALVQEWQSAPDGAEQLDDLLGELTRKLPREYLKDAGQETLGDPEWLQNMLASAERLLVNRLAGGRRGA